MSNFSSEKPRKTNFDDLFFIVTKKELEVPFSKDIFKLVHQIILHEKMDRDSPQSIHKSCTFTLPCKSIRQAMMAVRTKDDYYIKIETGEIIPDIAVEIAEPVKNYYSEKDIKFIDTDSNGVLIILSDFGPWENFLRKHNFM